jgi:methyl-accepting chemotaxis protein
VSQNPTLFIEEVKQNDSGGGSMKVSKTNSSSLMGGEIGFFHTIGAKFMGFSILMVVVLTVVVGYLVYTQSRTALQDQLRSTQEKSAQMNSKVIVNSIQSRVGELRAVAGSETAQSMDAARIHPYLQSVVTNLNAFQSMFVIGLDGKSIASSTDQPSIDFKERAYFIPVMQGKTVISDPVIAKDTGAVVIVFAVPIQKDGSTIGAVIAATPTVEWAKMTASTQSLQTDETYLINQNGMFITPSRFTDQLKASGDIKIRSELELKDASFGAQEALAGRSGAGEFSNYQHHPAVGAYLPIQIENVHWALLTVVDQNEAFAPVTSLRNTVLIIGLLAVVVMSILAGFFARQLTRPLMALTRVAGQISMGDLRENIEVSSRDEVGLISAAFQKIIVYLQETAAAAEGLADQDLTVSVNLRSDHDVLGQAFLRMIANLRQALNQVNQSASEVNQASLHLSAASTQAGSATCQIAATIQQVARGAAQQTDSVTRTRVSVEQMSQVISAVSKGAQEQEASIAEVVNNVSQISASVNNLSKAAEINALNSAKGAEIARSGAQVVEANVAGMQSIRTKVDESASKFQEMGARSQQIETIVATIEDIASQTNLLALNAAIEAARAGEQGKGFAVVADEVRKLAERSAVSTKEIGGLIFGIQATIGQAIEAMQTVSAEVNQGVQNTQASGEALNAIVVSVENAMSGSKRAGNVVGDLKVAVESLSRTIDSVAVVARQNSLAAERMLSNSSDVTQSIENIASVSEENSAAVEEVSASAEEMTGQVEEVAASAQSLADLAHSFHNIVASFKL